MTLSHGLRSAANVDAMKYISSATSSASQTSYTFAAQNIGDPATDRLVIVGASGYSTTSRTFTSITIGGTAATMHIRATTAISFPGGIGSLVVPSGSTADIVITFSGSASTAAIVVYAAYRLGSTTPVGTGQSSGTAPSIALTTVAGGVAMSNIRSGTSNLNWVGLQEDVDNFGSIFPVSAAHGVTTSATTNISVGTVTSGSRIYAVSWG